MSIASIAGAIAAEIVQAAIHDPAIPPVSRDRAAAAADAVRAEVVQRVAADPVIQHVTNTEPWYRSRVTWGALVTLATPLLAWAGWTLGPDDREAIVTAALLVGPAVGGCLTLYGRWAARAPIGR